MEIVVRKSSCDNPALRRRFHEQVKRTRENYVRFLIAGLFLCLLVFLALGLAAYWILVLLGGARPGSVFKPILTRPSLWWLVYTVLFFAVGYAHYKARNRFHQREAFEGVPTWSDLLLDITGVARGRTLAAIGIVMLSIPFAFPSIVFFCLEELSKGTARSWPPETQEIAYEIFCQGDRITHDFLKGRAARRPGVLRDALTLLVQMRLIVRSRKADNEIAFLRSIQGEELVEASTEEEDRR